MTALRKIELKHDNLQVLSYLCTQQNSTQFITKIRLRQKSQKQKKLLQETRVV